LRIDQTHRKWLVASLIILAMAAAVYIPYAIRAPHGPKGNTAIGLAFGIVGFVFMLFAGLLGGRKKVPIWRLGRAQAWMRGHLWLGFVSLPVILFHAGFHFGGPLTTALMVLLIIVVASGVFGAVLQNYLPKAMTAEVPSETIYEQIGRVRTQLIAEADELVASTESEGTGSDVAAPLSNFYRRDVRPFLRSNGKKHELLSYPDRAHSAFEGLRVLLPAEIQEITNRLEQICDEERQLRRQVFLHHWLHAWLLMHVPLSFALLLLACVHAIVAWRY
jgi:hypothetical protein